MDKKTILYVGVAFGVALVFAGSCLLCLKENNIKRAKIAVTTESPKKVEVVIPVLPQAQPAEYAITPEIIPSVVSKPSITKPQHSKLQKRNIAFRYVNSKPKTVCLVGDFNKWNRKANPMGRGKNFVWEAVLKLSPGEYRYAFIVDGRRINDPNNKRTIHLKSGKASVLKVGG